MKSPKTAPTFMRKLLVLCCLVITTALFTPAFSQVDFEFWFAAPYGNTNHAPQWPPAFPYKTGGRPIYLRLASQNADAVVTVSIPAAGITIANLTIPANSTQSVDLTPYIADIQSSNIGNVIENKGIYVRSTALITAYYEIASVLNTDIFSFKGRNALGTEFFAPLQNSFDSDPYHNVTGTDGQPADPAYSYIVIVASEDNTEVSVTPTADAVGIPKGTTKKVTLQTGQTYVVRALNQAALGHMGGTYITSTHPVAVTIGDDSVYPQTYTNSGDCEDYAGDQIVPTNIIGKEYIAIKGQGFETENGKEFHEQVFVTATKNGTQVFKDGALLATINAGQQVAVDLGGGTTTDNTFITASEPVYAFHISGYQCEMAGALLPPVDGCTGSYKMGFVRTYGTHANEEFYMNLMVKGGGEGNFLLNGVQHPLIQGATFEPFGTDGWKVARIYFPAADLPVGPYFLQNTTSLFHMAMMNSTAHDWGDGLGYRLMGSMYAYFSKFADNMPTATIVNNNDTVITVARGTKVSLLADGGYAFNWTGSIYNGVGALTDPASWDLLPPNYFMNVTNVENPYVIINADGYYKYTASITTECYGVVNRSVLIKIVPPANLNNIYDTLCATSPYTDISEFYNLANLNDTIVGRQGKLTGYYTDTLRSWYKWVNPSTQIWDDFETNRNKLGVPYKGPITVVANPSPTGVNTSASVGHLVKTILDTGNPTIEQGYTDYNEYNQAVWYDIDLTASPLNLQNGALFSLDVRYDGSPLLGWMNGNHNIYMEMFNESGAMARVVQTLPYANVTTPTWQHMTFDFSSYTTFTKVTKVRIRAYVPFWPAGTLPIGYYIDNINLNVNRHKEKITDPKHYRVTDNDTILVYVFNRTENRIDSTEVYFQVLPPGKAAKHVTVTDTCATNGNVLEGFDLTNYNYEVGGALVSDKIWYLDAALSIPVTNDESVNVTGTQTFWAKIDDECNKIGSLTIDVSSKPNVSDGTVSICENVPLGGNRGILDLSTQMNKVTTNMDATIQWYSDAAMTQLVPDITQVFAKDGDVYYANIYYNLKCQASAKLTVTVIPLSDITFTDFSICYDGGNRILTASPAGGTYFGTGVTGNTFNPVTAGVGTKEISYTVSNLSCNYTTKINATVHPLVTAAITQVPAGKIQVGQSAQLQGSILPAPTSNYNFTWFNPANLTNPTSLTPTTTALSVPTTYRLIATDKVTGCDDTTTILVDVYVPVAVDLQFSAKPVCAGTPVIVNANRTGGFGPFQYVWNIPVGVDYTMVNDSVVRLNNPQSNINITVTVTDLGKLPVNDVVSDTDVLTVFAKPSVTIANPTPTVCEGEPLTIVPGISGGSSPYSHAWTQDTQIISSPLNAQNAIINTVAYTGTRYLRYTVTDANLCTDFEDVTVKINPRPVVSAIANPDTTCINQPVQLLGTVVQGVTAGGTHKWLSNSGSLPQLTSSTIPNPILNTGTYGVHRFEYIFIDANGCSDTSDIVRVRIEPKPEVTINPAGPICETNLGLFLTANPTVPDEPNPTFTYNWTGAVTSTQPSPMLNVTTAGVKNITLTVTANNGCTSDPETIQVIVNPNPVAQIINQSPIKVCALTDLTLQANAVAGINYSWSGSAQSFISPTTGANVVFNAPSVNPSTVYNAILTATNPVTGCTATTNKDITVYKLPEVTLGNDLELCIGSSTTLNPVINYGVLPYQEIRWLLDTTELSNTGTMNPVFTQKDANDYKVGIRITDANGCIGYDEVNMHGLVNPTADAGADINADWNTTFNLSGNATGGNPGYTWAWQPQDSLLTANTVQNPTSKLMESTWFELEVTDSKGCKDVDSVLVTVIGQPITVTIVQHPNIICFGQSGSLEAIASGGSGTYTYEWFEAATPTVVVGTDKFLPITPTATKQYMVRVSSGSFTPATAFYTVTVYALPTLTIKNSNIKELCLNSTMLIEPDVQGASPFTYEWSDGGPLVITDSTYLYSNSQTPGVDNLDLTVTDKFGCKEQISVSITVNDLPTVVIKPIDPTVCVNSPLTLLAETTKGEAPYNYAWVESTGKLSPMVDEALFLSNAVGPFYVSVNVSDANGCTATANETVIVKPITNLKLDDEYTVCAGAIQELNINPNGLTGLFTMHWVGGDRMYIIDSSDVTNSKFRSNDAGPYELYYTIEDGNGCPRLDTVNIIVYPAVKIATLPDLDVCLGISVPIEGNVITAGDPASVGYSWITMSGTGSVVPTFGKQTTFNSLSQGQTTIKVIAGDQYCNDSTSFKVTVHPNPVVEITANVQPNNVPYTASVELNANITTQTTPNYIYSWEEAAAITSGQNQAIATTIPIVTTREYIITIEDDFGCKDSAKIRLSTEDIVIEIKHPCKTNTVPIKPNEIVTSACLNDENEICFGQTIVLVPQFLMGNTTGLTYSWKNELGDEISTLVNPTVKPSKSGTVWYSLTVTNSSGYSKTKLVPIVVHPNPTADITIAPDYNGNFYVGDAININGNPSGGSGVYTSHLWTTDADLNNKNAPRAQFKPVVPGTVDLIYAVEDNNGCKGTDSRSITLINPIKPNITNPDVCERTTVTYELDRNYPVGTIYSWSVDGGQINGSSNNPTLEVYWPEATTGKVSVYVQPPHDKPVSQEITVHVGSTPVASISGPIHVCQGDVVDYHAINANLNQKLGYTWAVATDVSSPLFEPYYTEWYDGNNDGLLTAVNAPESDVATVTWKNVGPDKVVLIARDGGCKVTVDLDVTVHPKPVPDFSYESVEMVYFQQENAFRHTDSIYKDKQVDFINETADTSNLAFFWDFIGDGVYTHNAYNTSYEFDESGDFMVHLLAVDKIWGCKADTAKPLKVIVNPNCGLKFPNAFTPDLSDNNTFFPVYNEGVLETGYELRIYNRWGTLLWTTDDKNGQWDGVYKGDISKQDVYVYHCKAVCEEKDPVTGKQRVLNIKGDVTVIR